MFIEYTDFSNGTKEVAFMIKKDDEYVYIIEPFAYELICLRKKNSWLGKMTTNKIRSDFFNYKKITYNYHIDKIKDYEILLSYPLSERDIDDFYGISHFFRYFLLSRSKNMTERIIYSYQHSHFYLSQYQKNKMFNFLFSHYYHKKDRLTVLLESEITKYIKDEEL